MILVGRGTYLGRCASPRRSAARASKTALRAALCLLAATRSRAGKRLHSPQDVYRLHDVNDLLVEGGSATASAFLAEDLVDRILIYRAPIIVGEGKSSFGYVGLDSIADAHGRWQLVEEQRLGVDRLEVYERVRES